ncbi:MAG: NAD(P)-binding protein [Microthrixaceae bacterium]|nr:NAD(P)-binding protein [Microthrixaceae bacterium]
MTATVTRSDTYDAVVIGGGPNGLICGAYLAKAGAKVLLIERRHETGGGLNTDEYFGFRLNLHAIYHMMSDVMPAYRDLSLPDFGLRYVHPHVACAFPLRRRQVVAVHQGPRRDRAVDRDGQRARRRVLPHDVELVRSDARAVHHPAHLRAADAGGRPGGGDRGHGDR